MAPASPTPHTLSKRKSLNDDLIIWHGMTAQNLSVITSQGLPFSLRRRKIWLDVVAAEVEKKSKSIVAQNFTFSTRPSVVGAMSIGRERISAIDDDSSLADVSPEARMSDIFALAEGNLPIRIDDLNEGIIRDIATIIATEVADNAEAGKILSFILYREQIPSNRRACIPTGPKACLVYTDVINACIQSQSSTVYKHMETLGVPREFAWTLLRLPMSEVFPLVLRVRVVDLMLVKGCLVLISVALAYLSHRRDSFLRTSTAAQFTSLLRETHSVWLPTNGLEAFWQKCTSHHNQSFLDTFLLITAHTRTKFVTLARRKEELTTAYLISDNTSNSSSVTTATTPSSSNNHVSHRLSTRSLTSMLPLTQLQHSQRAKGIIFSPATYDWIGFDVDHTLVEYKIPALLKATFEHGVKELQKQFIGLRARGSAVWVSQIAQRGVAVDTARGIFLHVTENGTIQHAFHGSHEVSYYSVNLLYGSFSRSDLLDTSTKLIHLNTAAEVVFAPLYAWIVDAFDSGVISVEELGSDFYLVPDIEDCGDHASNPNDPFLANQAVYICLSTFALNAARSYYATNFWKTICGSPETLISANVEISVLLETLKETHNKSLFVLTNGSWTHCDRVMTFAVGKDWLYYFDLVLTEANKDIFFNELNDTPFYEVLIDEEEEKPPSGGRKRASPLEKRKVYAHGNAKTLMEFFDTPDQAANRLQRVCYFGDHIIQDILQPSQTMTNWDLVAVIKEVQLLKPQSDKDMSSRQSWLPWLWRQVYRETPHVVPDLYSTFFFLGASGVMTLFGRKICDAAALCVPSVGVLARFDGVLRMSSLHKGWGSSHDLSSFSKRVTAKVRAIRHSSGPTTSGNPRRSRSQACSTDAAR